MLSKCPHCDKPIVVPEPGIHDCPRCEARVWIYAPDSKKPDRVLFTPESMKIERERLQGQPGAQGAQGARGALNRELADMLGMGDGEWRPPWETAHKSHIFRAFRATWRLSAVHPGRFFSRLKTDLPIGAALLYGWIVMTLGYFFWAMYRLAFMPLFVEAAKQSSANPPDEAFMRAATTVIAVASPLIALIAIYLNALAYHVVLWMLGVSWSRFRATMRIVIYSASPLLLLALPVFGDFIAFVWSMVVSVIGLSRVYKLNNLSAMLVVLLPPLAFYLLVLLGAQVVEKLALAPYVLP